MTHTYKGFRIEKCVGKQWNIYEGDKLRDATPTLADAKYLIRCWTDRSENTKRVDAMLLRPILG